jgi:hypothetical protein
MCNEADRLKPVLADMAALQAEAKKARALYESEVMVG